MEAIEEVVHYVGQHFDQDLSLGALAARAHYSPFHFHRLFKQRVGEAPKQYILRLRLEKATKELLFYPTKPVHSVALDAGFSSHPVFSRAFRNRFGMTAEQYRLEALRVIRERTDSIRIDVRQYPVTVSRQERIHLACEVALLRDEANIMAAFRRQRAWATARELVGGRPEYYGIFLDSPFTTALGKCRYLAGIRIPAPVEGKECHTLGGLTVARIPVMGNFDVLTDYALYVKQRWVRDSGYEIVQGVPGYEQFPEVDFGKPYSSHHRTICIGVRPE